ncbi:hypothetical protein [Paenibacillus sp. GCM10027626]|uniref:hypothetical protein n=1 Tax=Paenibacillus sp. GCM10027626 TaxID=3273411 RepID=UPI003640EA3A
MILERVKQSPNYVGASADEWIMATAKVTSTVEISALHNSGNFVIAENTLDPISMDLTEYVNTPSHIHKVGGDAGMVNDIAERFLSLSIVDKLYSYKLNGIQHYMILLSEDRDDVSFLLAQVKVEALDDNPEFDFEIRYTLLDKFDQRDIPVTAVIHGRKID